MGNHSGHESPKKAVFAAPLIMGLSFWVFAFFFLSLCDGPNKAHGEAAGHGASVQEEVKSHETTSEQHGSASVVSHEEEEEESASTDSTKKEGHEKEEAASEKNVTH